MLCLSPLSLETYFKLQLLSICLKWSSLSFREKKDFKPHFQFQSLTPRAGEGLGKTWSCEGDGVSASLLDFLGLPELSTAELRFVPSGALWLILSSLILLRLFWLWWLWLPLPPPPLRSFSCRARSRNPGIDYQQQKKNRSAGGKSPHAGQLPVAPVLQVSAL